MPGNLAPAVSCGVLPMTLYRSFTSSRTWPIIFNDYRNGENQRSVLAHSSRKEWRLSKRLVPFNLIELRDFYGRMNGPQKPFYFYDVFETDPPFAYDPSGQNLFGRYLVRFNGAFTAVAGFGLLDSDLSLIQVE